MKTFYIETYGCSRRYLDAERISNYFIANNVKRVTTPKDADFFVVVTCDLTKEKEDKVIDSICRLKQFNKKMFIYGCLPAMNSERLKTVYKEDTLVTKDLDRIDEFFIDFQKKFKEIDDANKIISIIPRKFWKRILKFLLVIPLRKILIFINLIDIESIFGGIGFNEHIFTLRISEGCLGGCSYCNIRKAIGKIKSKQIPVLLEELDKSLAKKKFNINIISSDTGAYGLDIGITFPELLDKILKKDKKIIVDFIQDLHPNWICKYYKELLELIKTHRIKSILTAIQSGNPRILSLMKRPVDLEKFKKTLQDMKKIYPELKLRTQVIVGFPSETEEEFQDTLKYIKDCNFDEVDIFAYYEVNTTDSFKIEPKVPKKTILKRIKTMKHEVAVPTRVSA